LYAYLGAAAVALELEPLGADDELLAPPLTDPWAELLMPELFAPLVLFFDPVLVLEPVPAALFPGRACRTLEPDFASACRITAVLELALELLVLELFPG
jgi:hypothetical protein